MVVVHNLVRGKLSGTVHTTTLQLNGNIIHIKHVTEYGSTNSPSSHQIIYYQHMDLPCCSTRHPYIVLRLQHFCPTTFLENFVSTCIRLLRNGVNQIKSVILYMFLDKNSQIWPILPQKSCSICLFWAEMSLNFQEI